MEAEELVRRTRAEIEKNLADYYIFEIDKNPVACVALHVYPAQQQGELASLYVDPSHENQGIGRKLIQFIENKARETGLTELIALSTQAFTYFQSKGGFAEGTPDDLPLGRREKYDQSGRNSKGPGEEAEGFRIAVSRSQVARPLNGVDSEFSCSGASNSQLASFLSSL